MLPRFYQDDVHHHHVTNCFLFRRTIHGAIIPRLNKYCNVFQIYCRVQFYITSLEYCSLGSVIYAEFYCAVATCPCVAVCVVVFDV